MSIIRANKFQGLDAPNPAIELPADGTVILASGFSGDLESKGTFTASGLIVENNGTIQGNGTVQGSLTIDGTTTVAVGASGTPAITASGDPNTGLFFPAADTTSFSQGGTERFRFGSAGQFGIGGATFGTTGQVLTSQGASAAPSWADGGGITWLAAATLTSQTAVTITGIDTTAQFIIIAIANGQSSGTAAEGFRLRLGNGSLQTGNVYRYNIADNASTSTSGADDKYLINQGTVSASQLYDGHILLTRVGTTDWAISQTCGNRGGSNGGTYGGGEYFGTDFIDRIQIANGATTYGAGTVRVGYIL